MPALPALFAALSSELPQPEAHAAAKRITDTPALSRFFATMRPSSLL